MKRSVRVLYLGPRTKAQDQLSAYSFIDEEIRALANAGVEAFVLGQTGDADRNFGRIHVRGIPPDTPQRSWKVGRFVLRHLSRIPVRNMMDPQQLYRAGRIECVAAEVIRRDKIDLIHSHFGYPRGFGGLLARSATGARLVAHLRGHDINTDRTRRYGSRSIRRSIARSAGSCAAPTSPCSSATFSVSARSVSERDRKSAGSFVKA